MAKSHLPAMLRRRDHTCKNSRCLVCPLLHRPNYVASMTNQKTFPVDTSLHCSSHGIVHLLTCRHCSKQYVSQTARSMRERLARQRLKFRWHPCPCIPTSSTTTILILSTSPLLYCVKSPTWSKSYSRNGNGSDAWKLQSPKA